MQVFWGGIRQEGSEGAGICWNPEWKERTASSHTRTDFGARVAPNK